MALSLSKAYPKPLSWHHPDDLGPTNERLGPFFRAAGSSKNSFKPHASTLTQGSALEIDSSPNVAKAAAVTFFLSPALEPTRPTSKARDLRGCDSRLGKTFHSQGVGFDSPKNCERHGTRKEASVFLRLRPAHGFDRSPLGPDDPGLEDHLFSLAGLRDTQGLVQLHAGGF